jgi:hypothetical protein
LADCIRLCGDIGPSYLQGVAMAAAMRGMTPPQLWKTIHQSGKQSQGNCFNCGKPGHLAKQCPQKSGGTSKPIPSEAGGQMPLPPTLCPRCPTAWYWANQCHSRYAAEGHPIIPIQSNAEQGNSLRDLAAWPLQTMATITFKPAQNPNGGFQIFKDQPRQVQDWTSAPTPESY